MRDWLCAGSKKIPAPERARVLTRPPGGHLGRNQSDGDPQDHPKKDNSSIIASTPVETSPLQAYLYRASITGSPFSAVT